jgi:hypothetical protein
LYRAVAEILAYICRLMKGHLPVGPNSGLSPAESKAVVEQGQGGTQADTQAKDTQAKEDTFPTTGYILARRAGCNQGHGGRVQ